MLYKRSQIIEHEISLYKFESSTFDLVIMATLRSELILGVLLGMALRRHFIRSRLGLINQIVICGSFAFMIYVATKALVYTHQVKFLS